ncbi:MAG: hypothetical protein ACYCUV_04915 [Phycisphaerae bacterium]
MASFVCIKEQDISLVRPVRPGRLTAYAAAALYASAPRVRCAVIGRLSISEIHFLSQILFRSQTVQGMFP